MLALVLVVLLLLLVVVPIVGFALGALLSAVVTGLVIGALGRLVVPGTQRLGLLVTIGVGLAGSLIGGIVGRLLHTGGFATFLLEVAVAAVLVAALAGRRRGRLRAR